jgi:hypothetical protein
MALNIKNAEVERLAAEVAGLANESKTEAIRRALADRKERLVVRRVKAPRRGRTGCKRCFKTGSGRRFRRPCAAGASPEKNARRFWATCRPLLFTGRDFSKTDLAH